MKVIKPTEITDAMLISSTVAEPDTGETAWDSGTSYAAGVERIRATTHRKYRSLITTTSGHAPESYPLEWEDIGPTMKWAMFDNEVNTQTVDASSLSVVIAPGYCNAIALLDLLGTSLQVTMTDGGGGPTVYDSGAISLIATVIADWYAYFFEPYRQKQSVVLTDLPPYLNGRITVAVTGPSDVGIGQCAVGTLYYLGPARTGMQAGIRDFSRKAVNADTGAISLTRGKYAKTLTCGFKVLPSAVNAVHQIFEDLLATPCVWIGDDSGSLEPLTVFGFYKDFRLDVAYSEVHFYTLELEGMI